MENILIAGDEEHVEGVIEMFDHLKSRFGIKKEYRLDPHMNLPSAAEAVYRIEWWNTFVIASVRPFTVHLAFICNSLLRRQFMNGPRTKLIVMLDQGIFIDGTRLLRYSPRVIHRPVDWREWMEAFPDLFKEMPVEHSLHLSRR